MIRVYVMNTSQLMLSSTKIKVEILLNKVLKKKGIPTPVQIETNNYGKPFLKDYQEIFFNGSHSGKYLVLAVSKYPVGIDIQEKREPKNAVDLVRRFMAPEDYEILSQVEESEKNNVFYGLWAQKESYMKYKGLGFSLPMTAFYVPWGKNRVYEEHQLVKKAILSAPAFDPDYALWVCGEEDKIVIENGW